MSYERSSHLKSSLVLNKKCVRHEVCCQMELKFSTKAVFSRQLERIKSALLSKKPRSLNNHEILGVVLAEGFDDGNETDNDSSGIF